MSNMSLLLRPSMLDDLGLQPALKWLGREVSRTTDLHVEVAADNIPEELPEELKTCVYRVTQEALRNCCRHAGAHSARVHLRTERTRLFLSVQDDGSGFDAAREKGLGLLGMEERVSHLGGRFQVDSAPGRGTMLSLELPLPRRDLLRSSRTTETGASIVPGRSADRAGPCSLLTTRHETTFPTAPSRSRLGTRDYSETHLEKGGLIPFNPLPTGAPLSRDREGAVPKWW